MASNPYQHITDSELLAQYRANNNDNKMLGVLLERYTLLLYGVCMKYLKKEDDAKDAVQQVFEKCIVELQKYEVTYFKSWLYMIAKNYCLMQLRSKGIHIPLEENAVVPSPEQFNKNEAEAKDQSFTNMEAALLQLSKEQHDCITLFYLQKKTYMQIAAATGYGLLQVKSNIQNGKRNLRLIMERMQQHGQ